MDELTSSITYLLSLGTLFFDLLIIFAVILIITGKSLPLSLNKIIKKYWLYLLFLISFGSTVASLYYSEFANFEPCSLCWYQRAFMFPIVFILGLAIYKKDAFIGPYIKVLCLVGSLIAIYHFALQMGVTSIAPCSATIDGASECSKIPFINFGYITIPIMSLTSFLLMLTIIKFSETKNEE